MTVSSRAWPLVVLALLLVTTLGPAAAHDENGQPTPDDEVVEAKPTDGYTGPSQFPYLSYYDGVWIYGQFEDKRIEGQQPRHLRGDGDWIVWEDAARSDLFLYSISAKDGFYITQDRAAQRQPVISGSLVAWEDYRDRVAQIYVYDIDTGVTKRISMGPGNHRNPSIHGNIVAWESDRDRQLDIYAVDVTNGTEYPVAATEDRESDPLVLKGIIYYATYRFNVWDIHGYDSVSNLTFAVTSDIEMNTAPFSNGREVLYLTQRLAGWNLRRYFPDEDRQRATTFNFGDASEMPADGDVAVRLALDVGRTQLVAINLSSGSTNHFTGGLLIAAAPYLHEKTAYVPVITKNGTSLLAIKISDFAFAPRPTLAISSPSSGAPWVRPINVVGVLRAGSTWAEPQSFTIQVDNQPPQLVPPGQEWKFTLDPAGFEAGTHRVTVRATFTQGPPVEASVSLIVPSAAKRLDVSEAGDEYHKARIFGAYSKYIGNNGASWFLIVLLLVVIAVLFFRLVLRIRGRRRDVQVEYVRP